MMSKPDTPTITMNDSDNSTNDDALFGVNTSSRLKKELQKEENNSSNVNTNPDFITIGNDDNQSDDIEIVIEDGGVTLDQQGNGSAITEHYESPIIKRNKK